MRPHSIRDTARGILLGAIIVLLMVAGVLLAAPSKADGYLSPQEERFGDEVAGSVCNFIDNVGVTAYTLSEAMKIIYINTPSYMDMSDAVDIINYSVYNYCPEHWDKLVAFGEGVRA